MAVHDLGYREWTGRLVSGWKRLFVIAATGVRRSWQNGWLRRTVFLAWLPTMWFGFGLFAWEQSVIHPEWQRAAEPFFESVDSDSDLAMVLEFQREEPEKGRHAAWAWLLQTFFRYPQAVVMVMIVGFVAPGLISQDIRSRAFLLYFSRPLNRLDYVIGKVLTLWFYLACVTAVPAIGIYSLGVLLSPQLEVLHATWDIPFRIVAASAVLMVPTSVLALCLSSLTQESRYAAFGWFAVWILGWFTYGLMTSIDAFRDGGISSRETLWANVSLYHAIGRVQSWIFGFTETATAAPSALLLCLITIVAMVILFRQVAAPMRA